MKKVFYSALLLLGVYGFSACNNGDYKANPSSPANGAVNPITPLKSSEFTWSGDNPLSADINGVHWKASEAYWHLDSTGANIVIASGGGKYMFFRLSDVWTGNVYDMSYNNPQRYSFMSDSSGTNHMLDIYYSNLDNSGGISIIQNDSAVIKAKFYYKGYDGKGQEVWIANGYMNISKF